MYKNDAWNNRFTINSIFPGTEGNIPCVSIVFVVNNVNYILRFYTNTAIAKIRMYDLNWNIIWAL